MAEYIDKEALKKSVEERYCEPCKTDGKDHSGCWCRACWVDDMLDEVECSQSADVAPVVHGRWIHYPDCGVTRCSHCGWSIEECWESKRCPDCGAKMDIQYVGDNDEVD